MRLVVTDPGYGGLWTHPPYRVGLTKKGLASPPSPGGDRETGGDTQGKREAFRGSPASDPI